VLFIPFGCKKTEQNGQKGKGSTAVEERKIRSMSVLEYSFAFGRAISTGRVIKTFHFDKQGVAEPKLKIAETSQYISTSSKASAVVFDSIAKAKSLLRMKFTGNRNISKQIWYGEHAEYVTQSSGETSFQKKDSTRWVVRYDKFGNKTEEIEYLHSGKIRTKLLYKYNANGILVQEQQYTIAGAHITDYDKYGNETIETWYDLLDEPRTKWIYFYEYY
jgi:hypothetical protein